MSESDAIDQLERPSTIDSLTTDFRELGLSEGALVLVHSSLSSIGWVSGAAVAVVEALQNVVGASGTIVMPTHSTHLSEPSQWENPPVPESWWPIIRESMPPYDPQTTPTRGMGAIPEVFRTYPDAFRGDHPQYSFTARGPLAKEIVYPHRLESGLGDDSPLGRIYANDGLVLLIGVEHDRNTSLHLAEYRAFSDKVGGNKNGSMMEIDGRQRWVEFDEIDVPDSDFNEIGKSLIEQEPGIVKSGRVGRADAKLMSQRGLVDFATRWLEAI